MKPDNPLLQHVVSRVVVELISDRATREELQKAILRAKRENEEDHKRLSIERIRHSIAEAVKAHNPELAPDELEARIMHRMEIALKPYRSAVAPVRRGQTAAEMARATRRSTVRKGRNLRR